MRSVSILALVSTLAVMAPAAATAATITGWNLDNVQLVPDASDPSLGVSKIYDRNVTSGTAGATSNGQILWTATPQPGMTVYNNDVDLNPGISVPDCVAVVGTHCEAPFQSDKRVKTVATQTGPIDMVFNTTTDGENNSYQFFDRLINMTPDKIGSFKIELGYGVGSDFRLSDLSDGLSFDLSVQLGPNNLPAFTQFPFGLFGDAASNPNQSIDGFFGTDRAGFGLNTTADVISTTGISSNYAALFGPAMLNNDSVPHGYFWDNDGDPATDPILMAWFDGTNWEQRRIIDPNDPTKALTITPKIVSEASLINDGFELDIIEDLRNLNLNFNVLTASNFTGQNFTVRIDTMAAVPEPGTWAMMIVGFGLVGAALRRKRQSVRTAVTYA